MFANVTWQIFPKLWGLLVLKVLQRKTALGILVRAEMHNISDLPWKW
jgi:hypothetical protein